LIALDQHWKKQVQDSRPGKRSSTDNLIKFHNHFVCWTGMRLSLLLALRETTGLALCADIDERQDRWIPIHDKDVPGNHAAMPVPLTHWVKIIIQNLRAHCKAMQSRLQLMGLKDSDLARWCCAVAGGHTVPLLCVSATANQIRPVGTADFINDAEIRRLVPPDPDPGHCE
jgi:hypothetical protein